MRLMRIWPVLALAVAALPALAVADARDYPGRLGDLARRDTAPIARRPHPRHDRVFLAPPGSVFVGPSPVYAAPPPTIYYAPPPVISAAPPVIFVPPPAYSTPPAVTVAPAPPPAPAEPPVPRVVEMDAGRWELRGDGVSTPYTWVWVPRPPTAPPGMTLAPRPPATLYRWVDERGVTTWTDDPNTVPVEIRALSIRRVP